MIGAIATHLWQSTWFAVLAGLLTVAFRRNRASVRYWLWFSASLKFFIPFALLMSLGSRLKWLPVAREIATSDVSFAIDIVARPFPASVSFVPAAPGAAHWTPILLIALWVCGFVTIALIRLRLWLSIRAAVDASAALDIAATVRIRSSVGLLEPGVVGFIRPVILLPDGIVERLTPSQLEAVLAHELCHVRRRDNLFASIHMIVEALFWFHPLVWWLGARLLEERERACDEAVLSLGSEPRIYADAILSVCRLCVESPLVCVSGVTGANLKRRIEAIMMNRTGHRLNRAKKFLLASAGVAALAGPVAIGVVIGIGHAPLIHAQVAQAAPPPVVALPSRDRRLVAMLFDFDTMTPEDQSRARQSAIDFVHNKLKTGDVVAVMAADNGRVAIAQDFTDQQAVLASAILGLSAGRGSASVPGAGRRLSNIEAAAKLLAGLPEKKALMYFSSGIAQLGVDNQVQLQNAIDAAKKSNMAVFPVDARGTIAQAGPAGLSDDEYNRRLAYAAEKFGSTSSAIARTYLRYGPPDSIEDRTFNAQDPLQIWRYDYLEDFHSSVEFAMQGIGGHAMHINWPPPLATYEGTPRASDTLTANAIAGLPGRHASLQIYPAQEYRTLSVPLDSLSGSIAVVVRIKTSAEAISTGVRAASEEIVQASAGALQENFILGAGSYVCYVTVKEQASGRTYEETIDFEVK